MKEPLDELLVQACAAQQRADLAALEQLEPANVPMPFVPQVRRTPRRLLKIVIIAAVCAVLATTAYAFWPRVAVILEDSRAYLAVQEAPQNSILIKAHQSCSTIPHPPKKNSERHARAAVHHNYSLLFFLS